jgi:hypothetical protein
MSIDNITFEKTDTLTERLTKTVHIFAGSDRLRIELQKYKVNYVKVCKGAKTVYVLRSPKIGRIEVKL